MSLGYRVTRGSLSPPCSKGLKTEKLPSHMFEVDEDAKDEVGTVLGLRLGCLQLHLLSRVGVGGGGGVDGRFLFSGFKLREANEKFPFKNFKKCYIPMLISRI